MSTDEPERESPRVFALLYKDRKGVTTTRCIDNQSLREPLCHREYQRSLSSFKIRVAELYLEDMQNTAFRTAILTHPPDTEPTEDTLTADKMLTMIAEDPERYRRFYQHLCRTNKLLMQDQTQDTVLRVALVEESDPLGVGSYLYIPENSKTRLQ